MAARNPASSGKRRRDIIHSFLAVFLVPVAAACSFDYGGPGGIDSSLPNIVMDDVDYVRVRDRSPQARFRAERAERFEERRLMELRNFSFEQYGNDGTDVNASGRAGSASVEIDSLDIFLTAGVRIDIESEDLAIETERLQWRDKSRTLSGGDGGEVRIFGERGTVFSGIDFHADVRRRSWEFSGGVSGTYVHEDNDDGDNGDTTNGNDTSSNTGTGDTDSGDGGT